MKSTAVVLRITVLDGTTIDGESTYHFDKNKGYITLGCDPDYCDVCFTTNFLALGMGGQHLGLQPSLGVFELDLTSNCYVELDGRPPYEKEEIRQSAELLLGEQARVLVEVISPPKSVSRPGKRLPQIADLAKARHRLQNGLLVLGLALLLLVVLVGDRILQIDDSVAALDHREKITGSALTALAEKLDVLEASNPDISKTVIDQASPSVYLVVKRNGMGGESPVGTAWVVDELQLATNAHVAESFEKLKAEEILVVRSNRPPYPEFIVSSINNHPGYKRFNDMWYERLPVQKNTRYLEMMRFVNAADVAVMTVAEPENKEIKLAPALLLADAQDLAALNAGQKIAFIGYPTEQLLPGAIRAPEPVYQQDEIVRMTDFFMVNNIEAENRLIQHALPVTGGASGSPILDHNGKVIGLVSAGNMTFISGKRIPSAASINFGQRADLLQDLLQGNGKAATYQLEALWERSFSQYMTYSEAIESNFKAHLSNAFGVSVQSETRITPSIPDAAEKTRFSESLQFPTPGLYLIGHSAGIKNKNFQLRLDQPQMGNVFSYNIPYGNLSSFQLVTVHGATSGRLVFKLNEHYIKHQPPEIIMYSLNQLHRESVRKLMQYLMGQDSGRGSVPEKLLAEQAVEFAKEVKGKSIYATSMEIKKPGKYAFIATSNRAGILNSTLLINGKPSPYRSSNKESAAIIVYKQGQAKTKTVEWVVYSGQKDLRFNLDLYFMGEEEADL